MEGPESTIAAENATVPPTSLMSRLTNIFVSPSEVFDEVKTSPPVPANWIVPLSISMVVGIIFTMVVFSQPAVIQHMKDAQEKAMQQKVTDGSMTQQQADQALEVTQKYMTPSFMKVFGILGSIVASAFGLFLLASVLWLIGRFVLGGRFSYMKAVEVTGLAMMIGALGSIVTMCTVVIYGDMSMTPGPILLVGHVDAGNKVHALLSALNVMSIWNLAVLSIGAARLSGTGILKPVICIFGFWYGVWSFFALALPMILGKK